MPSSDLLNKIVSLLPARTHPASSKHAQDKTPLTLKPLVDRKKPTATHTPSLAVDDYDGRLETIRQKEYPQLFEPKSLKPSRGPPKLRTVYLDHTGSTLYAASHIRAVAEELLTDFPANPHSQHMGSQWTHARVEQARDRLLEFFGTTPKDYAVVFTANATGAIRLASELTPMTKGGTFRYARESHNSVVGLRNLASDRGIATQAAEFSEFDDIILPANTSGTSLLAYPAQCNFSGERFSLDVADKVHRLYAESYRKDGDSDSHPPWWVLLDAAGYVSSSPLKLDMLESGPDFVAVSLYKVFGAPTGLGVLLVKRSSIPYLQSKRYFGGGTVLNVAFDRKWQEFRHDIESRLEDGTINFQAIISLHHALNAYAKNFVSIDNVARHITSVTKYALAALSALRHDSGQPMCRIYGHDEGANFGPIMAFNLKDMHGQYIGYADVERLSVMAGVALRTGRFCNPGASQKWLEFTTPELMHYSSMGFVCGDDHDIIGGKPVGALRISFGAITSKQDIDLFAEFLVRHYRNCAQPSISSAQETQNNTDVESEADPVSGKTDFTAVIDETSEPGLRVEIDQVVIYPIKSCRGWVVPSEMPWELTRFGLKFDRSFVVMRQNDIVPMQQKRFPKMALIRPHINTERSVLVLEAPDHPPLEVSLMADTMNLERVDSRICGNQMRVFHVVSNEISSWLSSVLSVTCFLACEPRLLLSDTSKVPTDLMYESDTLSPGNSPFLSPSRRNDMSFANEAQLLMVTHESARQVNEWIDEDSDEPRASDIGPMQYRPNLIVKTASAATDKGRTLLPFEELSWSGVSIGTAQLAVSGPCKRCQMIGVDQNSAKVLKEPYS
ncbi:hypothetical protein LPJ66_007122, partial [Kickxella alabastrina]